MKKGIAIGLALLFGAACGVGTTCAVYETAKGNAGQEAIVQEETVKDGAVVNAGVGLTATKISAENYATAGVAENVDSAYTLTATVNEGALNKRVKWSVAWKDAESAWATGKTVTDYVTITPSEEGSLTATATCLKDFGEQIIITVASELDESVNATCTVDYAKKVRSVAFVAGQKGDYWESPLTLDNELNVTTVGYKGKKAIQYSYDVNNCAMTMTDLYKSQKYTNYTIDDNFKVEYQLKVDESLGSEELPLKEGITDWIPFPEYNSRTRIYPAPLTYAVAYENEEEIARQYSCLYGATVEGCVYGTLGKAYQEKMESLSGQTGLMYMRVVYTGTYSTYTSDDMEIRMDISQVPVTSLTLDQTSILF